MFMQIEITLKNYRCFPDEKPATFSLQEGFTSFVGINNSGKSSLLKFFYEFRSLFRRISEHNLLNEALLGNAQHFDAASSILDFEEVFCNANDRNLEIQIYFKATNYKLEQDAIPIPNRIDIIINRGTTDFLTKLYLTDGKLEINDSTIKENILYIENNQKVDLASIFQLFEELANTLYIGPFRNALNVSSNEDYFDIKVGQPFIHLWKSLKTGPKKDNYDAAIRLKEDIQRVFGYPNLEINCSSDNTTLQISIGRNRYSLSEIGSGITQFILVLANAAIKQPSYILIDEPELNLHPSLQLDFLTTLESYAQIGMLFATHNIGLARLSNRIYSVHKIDEGKSELCDFESNPHLSELLGELSFSAYKELGFDKILLVEGRTDVKTMQQFLRLYNIDHNVVILPLGGNTLINNDSEIELREIYRISSNIFAIIDSEKKGPDQELNDIRQQFHDMCTEIGINCHVLKKRSTENYFTNDAMKKVMGDNYNALEPYQQVPDGWDKNMNWRIAREMTLEDLSKTDIGEFFKLLK